MTQDDLKVVFEDTQEQVNSGKIKSVAASKIHTWYLKDYISDDDKKYDTQLSVVNTDSVSAARELSKLGRTAILNMASPTRPGGGVRNGAKAQEECLFRCSDLFTTLTQDFYPLMLDWGIYTINATFFKDKDYHQIEPFKADVITVAAFCLNPNHHAEKDESVLAGYEYYTRDKIRYMFASAAIYGAEYLILGAWGCGVYKNDPTIIAKFFLEVYQEFKGCFKEVQFAVINDHNSVANNYEIFYKTLIG